MHYRNPYIAILLAGLLTLGLVFLLAAQPFRSGATIAAEPAVQAQDPIAVLKSIVVNGTEVESTQSEMSVTRLNSPVQPVQSGMLLLPGDEIATGQNCKATVLYLDAAPENSNEAVVNSNEQMHVGSIFHSLGRALVRTKGKFEAATPRLKVETVGTEYELVVEKDGTNRVRVLDGAVRIQVGNFSPSITRDDSRRSNEPMLAAGGANFLLTSFNTQAKRRPIPAETVSPRPTKMDFTAVRGRTTRYERDFVFTNRCGERHLFEIRAPRNMSWFQIIGADKFEVEGRQTSTISFAIKADTTQVPIGVYEGEIIARCVNCTLEQSCDLGGLILPISVSVIPAGSGIVREVTPDAPSLRRPPTPKVGPTVNQTSTLAQELQEVILSPDGTLSKSNASTGEIDEILNWSNEVIVAGQPTYSAQSIIPYLQSWQERAAQFRVARRGAILNNDPNSYEALGRIYVDWGNGAKAVDELRKAVDAYQTPERLTSLGEAYRLTGDLRSAQGVLAQTVRQYPDYAPGINALGTVYFDRAKIAQDKKDYVSATLNLRNARRHYGRARINSSASIISESNIGETELALGDIAKEQGLLDEALNQYKQAEQTFSRVEPTSRSYVFATKGIGDVYRGIFGIARIRQDSASANAAFARSEEKYRQAVRTNSDMSEAYLGLGRLYEENGDKDKAIRNYWQAIRVRPEMPQPYYYYAVAIYDRDPGRAAIYAKAYLKLEREVLKQGEKGGVARQVAGGQPPPITIRTVPPQPQPQPQPQPPLPSPGPSATVKVPGVNGNKPDDALRKLKERGLEGQLTNQPDCEADGKVVATNPKKDTKVSQGTVVIVYISSLAENAVSVPQVTNQSLNEAERELQNLGLVVDSRRRQETNSVAENTVLKQNPKPYARLNPGCKVELTISRRIKLIPVPNYIGLSREEALQRLQKISFGGVIRGSVTEVDSKEPPGTVIDQNPKPGEMVEPGTSVDLVISRRQPGDDVGQPANYAVVPNLYGRSLDQAKSILADAHLKLGNVGYKPAGANDPVDIVVSQSPQAHQKVPLGTLVKVVIAYIVIK